MGYYTQYTLKAYHPKGQGLGLPVPVDATLLKGCPGYNYAINYDGDTLSEVKWYDYDADMKDFSKLHPELIFELSGKGEEDGDFWRKAAKLAQINLYASYAKAGKLKNSKRQKKKATAQLTPSIKHAAANCGNPGCKRCFPHLRASRAAFLATGEIQVSTEVAA